MAVVDVCTFFSKKRADLIDDAMKFGVIRVAGFFLDMMRLFVRYQICTLYLQNVEETLLSLVFN